MERILLEIQHRLNPLHVYCRLIEKGINKNVSIRISRYYEVLIFKWLTVLSIFSIYLYRLIKGNPSKSFCK